MADCIDCLHFDICQINEKEQAVINLKSSYRDISNVIADGCRFFKNKADFVEVKHGEWEKYRVTEGHVYVCSLCGYRTLVDFDGEFLHHNYCTKCGADMRKEGADNG